MANKKILNTRIKNRYDTLGNWQTDGVELLKGEIALVSVTTQHTDDQGNIINVPAVLMKVGEEGKTFNELPWLSAKAADVYEWAKKENPLDIPVTVISDTNTTYEENTLGNYLQRVCQFEANFTALSEALNKSITDTFDTFDGETLWEGSISEADRSKTIVKAVTQENGKVKVTYGLINSEELPSISAEKIIYVDANENEESLNEVLDIIGSRLTDLEGFVEGGVHFIGEATAPVDLSASLTTRTVTINGKEHSANNGDIVIQNSKEFIWVATDTTTGTWKELGDLSRVGAVETAIKAMDVTATNNPSSTKKFVSQVTQADGKITVTYTQPSSYQIAHSTGTVSDALSAHDAAIASNIARSNSFEQDFIRAQKSTVNDETVYTAVVGMEEVIFDCGGALTRTVETRYTIRIGNIDGYDYTKLGEEFKADPGMTWSQWINSDYNNVAGLYIDDDHICDDVSSLNIPDSSSSDGYRSVNPLDPIINGVYYYMW